MASLKDFFIGTGPVAEQIDTYTPEQKQGISSLLQRGLQNVDQQRTPSFQPIADRARKQFQEQTLPSIAERFTAMGLQNSGYFPQVLGSAASDLESQLAALGSQFDLQQQQFGHGQTMDYLRHGLSPRFTSHIQLGTPGFLQQSLPTTMDYLTQSGGSGALGSLAGLAGGGLATSGIQALISLLSKLFQKRA